jgi:hypothetical protein
VEVVIIEIESIRTSSIKSTSPTNTISHQTIVTQTSATMSTTKTRYTTDLLSTPGMKFRIDIPDPKERIQAYIDEYAKPIHDPSEQEEVSSVALEDFFATRPSDMPDIYC